MRNHSRLSKVAFRSAKDASSVALLSRSERRLWLDDFWVKRNFARSPELGKVNYGGDDSPTETNDHSKIQHTAPGLGDHFEQNYEQRNSDQQNHYRDLSKVAFRSAKDALSVALLSRSERRLWLDDFWVKRNFARSPELGKVNYRGDDSPTETNDHPKIQHAAPGLGDHFEQNYDQRNADCQNYYRDLSFSRGVKKAKAEKRR